MKVLLVVGPENENRFSMTNYTNICKNIEKKKFFHLFKKRFSPSIHEETGCPVNGFMFSP